MDFHENFRADMWTYRGEPAVCYLVLVNNPFV
jgi:hypothetical protein